MAYCEITLLRHGATHGEPEGRYIGHTDTELTPEGITQLQRLQKEYAYPQTDAVFSSPLRRCTQTAALLYPRQKTIAIDGLKEYFFGAFENKTAQELRNNDLHNRWLRGEADAVPPFAERQEDFQQRICAAFTAVTQGLLRSKTERAVIVTHGGIIMALMSAFALPEAPMHTWRPQPCCGFRLRAELSAWMRFQKIAYLEEAPLR
jgi:alpha-ribazole phosphatase